MQGHAPPSRSCTGRPTGTDLTVTDGKLHLNERFACIPDRRPARIGPALWAGHRLRFPIDAEVGEVIAGLCLIPVCFERGANQIHPIARLRFHQIGDRDISRIHQVVIGKELLLSQIGMNCGENSLVDFWEQEWSRHE